MLLGRRGYLASMVPKVWFELRDGRGHPSCILHGFFPRRVTNNTDGDCFAFSGRCIGQENSRPRFGIIMTHLCGSHVVRSDFRSLLSCCYLPIFETSIPRDFENGFGRGFPPEVVCTEIFISSIPLLCCYSKDGVVSQHTVLKHHFCNTHYKECLLLCPLLPALEGMEPPPRLLSPSS